MSEWGWVAFGYTAAYGALTLYVAWTAMRIRRARRMLRELR